MNCWHCKTPLYAAGGRIFILRTLIWAARGVKGKAHCAISVVPTPSTPLRAGSCAKDAQEWGPPALVVLAGKASGTQPRTRSLRLRSGQALRDSNHFFDSSQR